MAQEEKIPVITTSNTSGLVSILQLTDDTPNEVFITRHSTSGTETILVVEAVELEKCRNDRADEEEEFP